MAISAITLAELSAGPHEVRSNDEQDVYDEHAERARRLEILQRAESEFDPVPFDAEAARIYGRVSAAVVADGRKPRRRLAESSRSAARPSRTSGRPAANDRPTEPPFTRRSGRHEERWRHAGQRLAGPTPPGRGAVRLPGRMPRPFR